MTECIDYDWAGLVHLVEADAPPLEDPAYEFSGGRVFARDPGGGPYADEEDEELP
jgi:hypothetical protein